MQPHIGLGCSSSDVSCLMFERVENMPGLSGHKSLLCQMTITAPSKARRVLTSRNTKAVSLPDFQADAKCLVDCHSQCPDRCMLQSWSPCSHGPPRPSGHPLRHLQTLLSPVVDWWDQRVTLKTTGRASLEVNSPDCPQGNLGQGASHREETHTWRQSFTTAAS